MSYGEIPPILRQGETIEHFPSRFMVEEKIPGPTPDYSRDPDYLSQQTHLAQVFRAEQWQGMVRAEDAAIKMFINPNGKLPQEIDFVREYGNHPNFPDYFAHGSHECRDGRSRAYVASEFVNVGTLRQAMSHESPVDEPQQIKVVSDITSALQQVHEDGFVYRDVKPANTGIIEVSGDSGEVKGVLLDLATIVPIGSTALASCTQEYADPLLVAGYAPVPAHDMYSVGKMIEQIRTEREDVLYNLGRLAKDLTVREYSKRPDAVEARGRLNEIHQLASA